MIISRYGIKESEVKRLRTWLKTIRENKKLSQTDIAEQSGISQNYYSSIETGERGNKLPVETAKKIAAVLDFKWTLFYEDKDKAVNKVS